MIKGKKFDINKIQSSSNGYIALASVLVIAAVVLIIGTSVALFSINDIQSSLSHKLSDESLDLIEGCAEDALIRLNQNNAIPATITLPQGSCSVTINLHSGNNWTFTVSGNFSNHTKGIQIQAVRTSSVSVTSWNEL